MYDQYKCYSRLLSPFLAVLCTVMISISWHDAEEDVWGFFGHRLINRTAVFTLPVELIPLFKSNIDFVTEHSIDPDKRRYASPLEAVRHYIDLDHWGNYPFDEVPRRFHEAMAQYGHLHIVDAASRDTLQSWTTAEAYVEFVDESRQRQLSQEIRLKTFELLDESYLVLPKSWIPNPYKRLGNELIFTEYFSSFGILPYHLSIYQGRLTKAFRDRDWPLVIRLSTEIGHYLSDAHVPLHTTENYNGQMTGQDGIHAFWESRIPELFASDHYDFFVGRAKYIDDTDAFFWNVVLESHTYVEEVLSKELEIRENFDKDKQYCFEQRGAATTRLECKDYAEAYQNAMEGMVEERMRKSIQGIGSIWYTAWIDAGRPNVQEEFGISSIDTATLLQVDTMALMPDTLITTTN